MFSLSITLWKILEHSKTSKSACKNTQSSQAAALLNTFAKTNQYIKA